MSHYEQDGLETARQFDSMIRDREQTDPNALNSVITGSRPHSISHSPVTEGIDEG